MSFEVKLPLFEGPFDLLLFFIERDELDIYDIPIAKITDDFLGYLNRLEDLNIEVASEFILVASTLMRIKAKMLLPRPQLNEAGEEIDPREELVKHLLEYKKYKSVVADLANMEEEQSQKWERGNALAEQKEMSKSYLAEAEWHSLDLYQLMRVFYKVMKRHELESQKPVHQIVPYPYTIEQQRNFMLGWLQKKGRLGFDEIIAYRPDKIFVIFTFLAILELLQRMEASLQIGEGFNNFYITVPATK